MKNFLAFMLAAALSLSLVACGGGGSGDTLGGGNEGTSGNSGISSVPKQEESPIESKGLFLLEREDGVELDDLTAQQTYLIHVYDIHPDSVKNIEMSVWGHDYIMTMNGVNEYHALNVPKNYTYRSSPNKMQCFMLASGYAAAPELGTVLAGGETIRVMSAYIINLNDIKEDTTATFEAHGCDIYDRKLKFDRDDIISISRFDDVFQIEDDPTDYQIAAAYFQRIKTICNNQMTGVMFDRLTRNGVTSYETGLTMIESWTTYAIFDVTGIAGFTEEFEGEGVTRTDLPRFDREAVKRVYPDLPVDAFEDSLETWLTNGKIAIESLNNNGNAGNEGDLADAAVLDMTNDGNQILEYYTAKLTDQ